MIEKQDLPEGENRKSELSNKQYERQIKKEYMRMKKINHPHVRTLKKCLFAFVVGVLIGAVAVLWVQYKSPHDSGQEQQPDVVSVVFERIVKQDELVVASQDYKIIEKVKDTNRFFDLFDIPFTENSFWYQYVGTIKVAVDLSSAEYVGVKDGVISICLDCPYISSNTPNMNETCVLEENNNVLNPIHIQDIDEYKKICVEKAEEEAKRGDLFMEARANAELNLSQLFSVALADDYQVAIVWNEEKIES